MQPTVPTYAIHRYPTALIEQVRLPGERTVLIRPVLPQDADLQQAFVRAMSFTSRRRRFHGPVSELTAQTLRYMTEVDYNSHLALLAEVFQGGRPRQVAEARWVRRTDEPTAADFALVVADDCQRFGLGSHLLWRLQTSARERGVLRLCGEVLADNAPMIGCMRKAGFRLLTDPLDESALTAEIDLAEQAWRKAA